MGNRRLRSALDVMFYRMVCQAVVRDAPSTRPDVRAAQRVALAPTNEDFKLGSRFFYALPVEPTLALDLSRFT
jgi:hypothetical protein